MPPTDTTIDGQLELKKRARRRLVGAAALALLAAVVLPIVMDHEPRQPAQEVQVRIPSQEGGGVISRVLPRKPEATPLPPAEPDGGAVSKPEPRQDAKPEPKPESKPEPKPAPKPDAKPEPKAESKAAAAEKAVAKPAEKAPEKPAKAASNAQAEAAAMAALGGESADNGKWVVQLGAYKEEGRVKILQTKLKEMNLPVFTEKVETQQGARTRVRAGPFKNRDAADQALARIRKIGVDGSVVRQ